MRRMLGGAERGERRRGERRGLQKEERGDHGDEADEDRELRSCLANRHSEPPSSTTA